MAQRGIARERMLGSRCAFIRLLAAPGTQGNRIRSRASEQELALSLTRVVSEHTLDGGRLAASPPRDSPAEMESPSGCWCET